MEDSYESSQMLKASRSFNTNKKIINPEVIYFHREKDGVDVEIAMQYNDSYSENIFTFVNNIHTPDGGTHMAGFSMAITRVIGRRLA